MRGYDLELVVLKQADRELRDAPRDIIHDVFALFEDLLIGKKLSLPISRALPTLSKGLHELRLSGRAGEYRVFYIYKKQTIFIVHCTAKKTQKIDKRTRGLLEARIRSLE